MVRFETPPSKQMQAEFTHIRRGRDPLTAFVATLRHTRSNWVRFTADERTLTWFGCLRQAFLYFGGVPRHVLFDSPALSSRAAYGDGHHRWHNGLLAVGEEFGFIPVFVSHTGPRPSVLAGRLPLSCQDFGQLRAALTANAFAVPSQRSNGKPGSSAKN